MSKKASIVLITLLSILLAGVIFIMILLFKGDYNFNFNFAFGESKTLVEEKEIINQKSAAILLRSFDVQNNHFQA